MVHTREQAVRNALNDHSNTPGACQYQTRLWFGAASAGDYDGDGAADAEDGWKKEPVWARHYDRHPPAGVPVSYLGGSHDNGHRAISLGNGRIRSTDAAGLGRVATVDLAWPERNWGLRYAGWSETIDGYRIPKPPPPPPPTRGSRVDEALKKLKIARKKTEGMPRRKNLLGRAIDLIKKVPYLNR